MALYLDPKADLTFKKVFGEHKDLLISFLNALLPLSDGGEIASIEYLPTEMVPDSPLKKDTIVDVRCKDQYGHTFIVEMQMIWTQAFQQRVLFNASKAYTRQLDKGGGYTDLQPVFSLNLVNDVFRNDTEDCYHDYGIVDMKYKDQTIEGIHLIFIELPKFRPQSFSDKKMAVLWLRYLTEINEHTRKAPQELLDNPETSKALGIVEESAYSEAQKNNYDHFWDMVSVERTLVDTAKRNLESGRQEGREEGRKEGYEAGVHEERLRMAKAMNKAGYGMAMIQQVTGLSQKEIESL